MDAERRKRIRESGRKMLAMFLKDPEQGYYAMMAARDAHMVRGPVREAITDLYYELRAVAVRESVK